MAELVPAITPSISSIIALVTNSARSTHTKRAYERAITDFFSWCRVSGSDVFSKAVVQQYRTTLEDRLLSPSTVKVHLCAIRRLAEEMADNGWLDTQSAVTIAKVKGPACSGLRVGNWLSVQQAAELLELPNCTRLKGTRDRAILSVLLGAGLRRAELCSLEVSHLQQREGRWVIADLVGKRGRVRTVPIPGWCKAAIDRWVETAELKEGRLFRPLNKAGRIIGESLSPQTVLYVVTTYRANVSKTLSPHDLRRTFAKLAHKGHAALEQIQLSLGHESIVTTERYLGVRQDLIDAPCDRLGIHPLA